MRRKIVETGDVDVMISIRSNFFYARTVPCELWHFDRAKPLASTLLRVPVREDLHTAIRLPVPQTAEIREPVAFHG